MRPAARFRTCAPGAPPAWAAAAALARTARLEPVGHGHGNVRVRNLALEKVLPLAMSHLP